MTVCTGTGLRIDGDGILVPDICGNRARSEWPYDCDMAIYNDLHLSPTDDCLWASPYPFSTITEFEGTANFPGTATFGSPVTAVTLVATVVNTDPCRSADVMIHADLTWHGGPVTTTDFNFERQIIGVDVPDGAITSVFRAAYTNSQDHMRRGVRVHKITGLAAGASQDVTVTQRVSVLVAGGLITVYRLTARIHAIVLPILP